MSVRSQISQGSKQDDSLNSTWKCLWEPLKGKLTRLRESGRSINQSVMVLSSQCIHSSEAQHGVGGALPWVLAVAVKLHSCTTPKHSPSSFDFSCFLICKIIVLNKLCDGVLWNQLMGAYRVHLFPTHVQWPHLGSLTSAIVGVFTP